MNRKALTSETVCIIYRIFYSTVWMAETAAISMLRSKVR